MIQESFQRYLEAFADQSTAIQTLEIAILVPGIVLFLFWGWQFSKDRFDPAATADRWMGRPSRAIPIGTVGDALFMFAVTYVIRMVLVRIAFGLGYIEIPPSGEEPSEAQMVSNQIPLFFAVVFTMIASVVGVIGLMAARMQLKFLAVAGRLGLKISGSDVVLGLKAALLILPPVIFVSELLELVVPYEHPVIDSLAKLESPLAIGCVFLTTAFLTPIYEELLFRGLLLGGLDRTIHLARLGRDPGNVDSKKSDPEFRGEAFAPVWVSALAFAAMHWGQGAAPVPLFILALGLGFLAQRTGSLIPSIVIHATLNLLALIIVMIR